MSNLKDSIKKKVKNKSAIDVLTAPIDSKQSIHSKQGLQSKKSLHDNNSIHSNTELQSKQDNIDNTSLQSKQDLQDLQSNQGLQDNTGKQELQHLHSNGSLPVKQSKSVKQGNSSKPSNRKGLNDGWTRATFIMREGYLDKVKDYAYWERLQIKDVIDDALENYFLNKKVRKRPSKKEG